MPSPYDTTRALLLGANTATEENDTTKGALEAMVDLYGLAVVVSALADVCDDKTDALANVHGADAAQKRWAIARDYLNKACLSTALGDLTPNGALETLWSH
jgi:hypothetical protein